VAFEVITITSDWFDVSYQANRTYIIEEPQSSQGNVSYLLIGDDRAIMFDTGSGENQPVSGTKIQHVVRQLTNQPVTLLLSHFHFDHDQNIDEFDSVAFPDLSELRLKISSDNIYSFTAADLFLGDYPSQVEVSEWLPLEQDIDLGNRTIQLLNVPGHTSESIAIIDKTNKLAFLGDFLYNGTLFLFDRNDIPIYDRSLHSLVDAIDSNYRLFGAHGKPEIKNTDLLKLDDFLHCIQNNICQGRATELWDFPVRAYEFEGMQILIFQ